MNGQVHYTLTKRWAREEGFSEPEAETIARGDIEVDSLYPGRQWRFKVYHLRWFGARRRARDLATRAEETQDLRLLGMALHCEQDAWSHGHIGHIFHYPGIDIWDRRSDRVHRRIESATRAILRRYRLHSPARATAGRGST